MPAATVVHVVPQRGGQWEVRLVEEGPAFSFMDLGLALDVATLLATGNGAGRVVVHESPESKVS
ncbi:MAG: hypothetical protein C0506_09865 [Anaerolinea sp.]|nr:hypothetical protein [Anaerolinea sp.]